MTRLRLLLDQMIDASVARALLSQGHDVVRTSEVGMAREDDAGVLQRAVQDDRVLVTLDKHFGDWAVLPLSVHPGVIRIKADPATSDEILSILLPFLDQQCNHDFRNQLVIVRKLGVRWISTAGED